MENPILDSNQAPQPNAVVSNERELKTPQKQREKALAYYYANREKIRNRYNKFPEEVREIRRARARLWRAANKVLKAKYDKEWREANPERWRVLSKKQRNKPKQRIIHSLRRRLRDFAATKNSRKSIYFGCTSKQLREHIEKQFRHGMSWENYGEWHIDHIVPCKMFEFAIEAHRKLCFNWRNLRPLSGPENVRRQASFVESDMALLDSAFILELKEAGILSA